MLHDPNSSAQERFDFLKEHMTYTEVAPGAKLTQLDLRVCCTLVNGKALTTTQSDLMSKQDLSRFSRAGVALGEIVDLVCTVLDAKEPEPEPAPEPEPTTAAAAIATGVTAVVVDESASVGPAASPGHRSRRLAGLSAEAVPADGSHSSETGRRSVQTKLARLLFESRDPKLGQGRAAVVVDIEFDTAHSQYMQLLSSEPGQLVRVWDTHKTVMQELNVLQGEDEGAVFSGITTRPAIDLYIKLIEHLSHDNTRKVSTNAIATAWNAKVRGMIVAAQSDHEAKRIQSDYGFVGSKDVEAHQERLKLRSIHLGQRDEIEVPLRALNSDLSQSRQSVPLLTTTAAAAAAAAASAR